jgi:transposase
LSVKHSIKETDEMIKHSEEFKQEAVRIALSSGLPRARVAADLGVGKSTLGKWVADYRPSEALSALHTDLAKENERLRLENRVLKEERDILKKHVLSLSKGPHSSSRRNGHEVRVYRCLAASVARCDPLPCDAGERARLSILAITPGQSTCTHGHGSAGAHP